MTEVISEKYVLCDSMRKTRPNTDIFYRTDANAGLNDIRRFQNERSKRFCKFPNERGNPDAQSFAKEPNVGFKKFEDEGAQRSDAPYRDYDNIVDPISGFISAGAAFDRCLPRRPNTVYARNDGPQYNRPQDIHSIRKGMPGAYPEIDRASEFEPPGMFVHEKRMSPGYSRAVQGGWTSQTDQTPESGKLTLLSYLPKAKPDMSEQDRMAYKYAYTSTTQSAYEAVPFERSATGGFRPFPPTHTLERHADPVSLTNNRKQTLPPADSWCAKNRGVSWDFKQMRPDYFNRQRPFTFCSPTKRASHLPTYSGCSGAVNPEEVDNPYEPYKPFTVLRTEQPKFAFSGAPRDIPGYTGHRSYVRSVRSAPASRESETQSRHPAMPVANGNAEHRRDGELAKMVTTVPPCNPFKAAEK